MFRIPSLRLLCGICYHAAGQNMELHDGSLRMALAVQKQGSSRDEQRRSMPA